MLVGPVGIDEDGRMRPTTRQPGSDFEPRTDRMRNSLDLFRTAFATGLIVAAIGSDRLADAQEPWDFSSPAVLPSEKFETRAVPAKPESLLPRRSGDGVATGTASELQATRFAFPMSRGEIISSESLVRAELRRGIGIDAAGVTLGDLVDWLRTGHRLNLVVDFDRLDLEGFNAQSTLPRFSANEPIVVVLDRIGELGIGWHQAEDGVLEVSSRQSIEESETVAVHQVADLLAGGLEIELLEQAIIRCVDPDTWAELGGRGISRQADGGLIVNQNPIVQRQIKGFLDALRRRARDVRIDEPANHLPLQAALDRKLTIRLEEAPLSDLVQLLESELGTPIDLDRSSLELEGIDENTLVTVHLVDCSVNRIIASLSPHPLVIIPRQGRLSLTTHYSLEDDLRIRLFELGDLAADLESTYRMVERLELTSPDTWEELGGSGRLVVVGSGLIAVRQNPSVMDEVAQLIERLRVSGRVR